MKGKFHPEEISTAIDLNHRKYGPRVQIDIPVYGGGMSFGSISKRTMLARAMAAKEWNTFTCTGEGGYPGLLIPYKEHVITQIATGCSASGRRRSSAPRSSSSSTLRARSPVWAGTCCTRRTRPRWRG